VAASIALVVTDLKRAIAYSTMSQIGYMFVGVSIGAYGAGLFHLMTHAYFKALLFMAAGSIIAAMANDQNIDRMGGFSKAMRFTSITFVCGALALAAFPGTSGFFSKDEILAFAEARGGMYLIFTVLGYVGALMTAVYSFRLVFRVLPGTPCPEAQELIDTGHVAHEAPKNPATGEPEDTDVGFPGPEHHIAEREQPMKIAMGTLAVLTKQEFMLLMVGGVFVIEAVSVMLQVCVFKMTKRTTGTGRRLFKMTPLHHHFEMQDWRESKIVFRFLILAILFALLSLSTLKLR